MKTYTIEPLRSDTGRKWGRMGTLETDHDWNEACLWASKEATRTGVEMAIFGEDRELMATFGGGDLDNWIRVKSGPGIGIKVLGRSEGLER